MTENKLKTGTDFTWRDVEIGNIITEPGNAAFRRTGEWRSQRPTTDREKCNRCGLCWLYCPDAAVEPLEDGYYEPTCFTVKDVVSAPKCVRRGR